MEKVKIRALRPDEVEVRAANVTAKGAQFLIYKDARVDKRILDETFGIFGWRNRYETINNNLYCTVDIWDEDKKEWISKCDCGTESNTEKEKGEASDAFKRACFNIGIGRELYTKIFIFIAGITKPDPNREGKFILTNPYEKYSVAEMLVDKIREKITKLIIQDSKGKIVFLWEESVPNPTGRQNVPAAPQPKKSPESTEPLTKEEAEILLSAFEARHGKCERGTEACEKLKALVAGFGVKKLGEIPHACYADAVARIADI